VTAIKGGDADGNFSHEFTMIKITGITIIGFTGSFLYITDDVQMNPNYNGIIPLKS
jgi:hypothetical protein